MRTQAKKGLIGLALVGLALGGALASAQGGVQVARGQGFGQGMARGFGRGGPFEEGRGFGGFSIGLGLMGAHRGGWGGLMGAMQSAGTTTTVTFYDGDPASGGQQLSSLSFTAGEDSESAFMQAVAQAQQDASFAVVETSEQTRTVDLSALGNARGAWDLRGLPLGLRALDDGSTVTVTFYDGDPAAGGQELSTSSFTLGQDSELAFRTALEQAAQDASYATITLSPQTRTIDLSAAPAWGAARGPMQGRMPGRGWR